MYPSIEDPNFETKITKKYSRYKIPPKKKSFDQICFPKEYTLQIPQKFVAEYINPNTPYKRILIYHKIGGGKTCAAITIAEKFIPTNRKIIVVLPAFLIGNFRNEIRSQCTSTKYISEEDRQFLIDNNPTHLVYKSIIDKSDQMIDKYYNIYSYNKFIDNIINKTIKLNDSLLIIDEIQNMVSENGVFYDILYKTIRKLIDKNSDFRFVMMTATPIFDKPAELALTLNLLLPTVMPTGDDFYHEYLTSINTDDGYEYSTKNMDQFKSQIRGYVSYYAGAPSYVFPKYKIQMIKCEMSNLQLRMYSYISKLERKDIDPIKSALTNRYYSGTRSCSNFAYPDITHYLKMKDSDFILPKLKLYSSKYIKILSRVNNSTGTVFIYSNFKKMGGIQSLSRAFEMNGYSNYATNGEGSNRFAIWSGKESSTYKDLVRSVFNSRQNKDGSMLKIIFGTPAIREGVSLLRLREIHILEPYWNFSRIEQVIGRGVRFCSHADLPIKQRNVDVYIYLSVHKKLPISVDQKIMNMAIQKKIINIQFEQALKEAAVDCELFSNANQSHNDDYVCQI